MSDIIQFIINVTGNARGEIEQIGDAADDSTGRVNRFTSAIEKIRDIGLKVQSVASFFSTLTSSVQGLVDAYNMQVTTEAKLAVVMRNTMSASQEDVNGILELTSALEKLGVVSGDVQVAGAQEMATYLGEKESLEKLIPALNDMLAQQYGLNATQEQAVAIGTMLGKVMQGQTGALSRYGYAFDNVQEKILKTGTEAERAAVLFDVVSEAVGGVNAALAQTPGGKLKQLEDNAGSLQVQLGRLIVLVQSAFSGVYGKVQEMVGGIISYVDKNIDAIMRVVSTAANVVSAAFSALGTALRFVWDVFTGFLTVMQYVAPALALIGVYLAAINAKFLLFAVQFYAYTSWLAIVTAATKLWAAVQAVLNAVLTANPVGLIVVGIVALIAVITFLAIKIKGWGTLWDATIGFMQNIALAFVESIKLAFNGMVGGIMIALDKIRLGWYQFKNAVGLGDQDANNAMIAQINSDVETRKQAVIDGANKVAEYSQAAIKSFEKVNLSWDSKVTLTETTDKLKSQLGFTDNTQVINNTKTSDSVSNISQNLSATSNSISAGGQSVKNFNITINDGLINHVNNHFGSSEENPESASDFMWRLSNALQMMLNDVNYAAN
jgi:hypothetical protein